MITKYEAKFIIIMRGSKIVIDCLSSTVRITTEGTG